MAGSLSRPGKEAKTTPHSCDSAVRIRKRACGEMAAERRPHIRAHPELGPSRSWSPAHDRACRHLIGRAAELGASTRRSRARAGAARPSTLVGEPGIGKTRLLAELGRGPTRGAARALRLRLGARGRPAVLGLRRRARRVPRRARPGPPADPGATRHGPSSRTCCPSLAAAGPGAASRGRALPDPPGGPRAARGALRDQAARARARRPPLGGRGLGRADRHAAAPPAGARC